MWLLAIFILVLLMGGLVLVVGTWFAMYQLLYGEWRGRRWTPRDFSLLGQWVSFDSWDGVSIEAYRVAPKNPKAWIIVIHGFNPEGGFVGAAEFWPYAERLVNAGFGALILDLPGFGKSARRPAGYRLGFCEWQDVVATYEYLRAEIGEQAKVGLFAKSAGTPSALIAAAKGYADFVALESAIASFGSLMAAQLSYHGVPKAVAPVLAAWLDLVWRFGFRDPNVIDPICIAGQIRVPVLFLRGGQDPEVLEDDTRRLAREIGELAQVARFPEAGHNILRLQGGPESLINEDEARRAWTVALAFLKNVTTRGR